MERALTGVRERIERACRRAGRAPEEVLMVAVTKEVPLGRVEEAVAAGADHLGENHVQELERKRGSLPGPTWHLLGRVQANKARRAAEAADWLHALEPGRGAERLVRLAAEGLRPRCLVQVDPDGDRVGVRPELAEPFVREMVEGGVAVAGLMIVGPRGRDPRDSFRALRQMRDRLARRFEDVVELSMGMSADLEPAVEEGATIVRVGSAIFGPRR